MVGRRVSSNCQVNHRTGDGMGALGGAGGGVMEGVRVATSYPGTSLTDGNKKESPLMTPTRLPPSREEPDGSKAPHCCPLTQDHQGPRR